MTCVIGYTTDEGTWIGADSAGTDEFGTQTLRADAKVFYNGPMLFGFCGSFRMGQLLRYQLRPTSQPDGMGDYEYMVSVFIEDVRKVLRKGGFTFIHHNEEVGGTFLVAYRDGLYCVESDFQVAVSSKSYACIGSGEVVATGAMEVLVSTKEPATKAIRRALKIASEVDAFVRPPFIVRKHKG